MFRTENPQGYSIHPAALPFLDMLNLCGKQVYLVGGAVRDLLLDRRISDYDIALIGAKEAAREISANSVRNFIKLGEKDGQHSYRIMVSTTEENLEESSLLANATGSYRFWLDLTELQKGSIQKDLARRDFTINAMALPLSKVLSYMKGRLERRYLFDEVIDPFGGLKDLELRSLKELTSEVFHDDPLRLWRIWRISAELDFEPTQSLLKLATRDAHLISKVAGERIRAELLELLALPHVANKVVKAGKCHLVDIQFAPLGDLKKCYQGIYHHQDAWEHSFQVLTELEKFLNNLCSYFPRGEAAISEWLAKGTNLSILKISAILHDIGKPLVRKVDQDNLVRFIGHEHSGLPLIQEISSRLSLSRRETNLLLFLVKNHLRIKDIISRAAHRNQVKFWRLNREDALGLVLLSCADLAAKAGPGVNQEAVSRFISKMAPYFVNIWIDGVSTSIETKPILSGNDIMLHFSLEPGKQVGLLKDAVYEAQLEERVHNREEALSLARSIMDGLGKAD